MKVILTMEDKKRNERAAIMKVMTVTSPVVWEVEEYSEKTGYEWSHTEPKRMNKQPRTIAVVVQCGNKCELRNLKKHN
jgi:hypothetical protein